MRTSTTSAGTPVKLETRIARSEERARMRRRAANRKECSSPGNSTGSGSTDGKLARRWHGLLARDDELLLGLLVRCCIAIK